MELTEIRSQLTKMTDRIIMRLHDRACFPLNRPVYERGGVKLRKRAELSFLELAIEELEAYHALLGRFDFPEQRRLGTSPLPSAAVDRIVGKPEVPDMEIDLRARLLAFYIDTVLPRLCAAGDDSSSYGETVYVDADLLELLHERINIGRKVAVAKAEGEPGIWDVVPDASALRVRLRDRGREAVLLGDVETRAARYDIDPKLARAVFEWIIEQTLDVEVATLQGMKRP